jgi:predicted RNA-binding protein YlxR (DUF448 family)
MCVVTREIRPIGDLVRFVVGPNGDVVPDVKRNLPGRGLWVTATREAIDQAIRRKLFAKGFKRDVRSGPELGDLTDRLLERASLDALAIAGKAGQVVTGFTKVEAAIQHGNGLLGLLHASDGSPDGARKAAALLNRNQEDGSSPIPVIRAFSGAQLDLALGRSNVIHAALLAGPASQGFLTRCLRMMRFRTGELSRLRQDDALDKEPKGTESE